MATWWRWLEHTLNSNKPPLLCQPLAHCKPRLTGGLTAPRWRLCSLGDRLLARRANVARPPCPASPPGETSQNREESAQEPDTAPWPNVRWGTTWRPIRPARAGTSQTTAYYAGDTSCAPFRPRRPTPGRRKTAVTYLILFSISRADRQSAPPALAPLIARVVLGYASPSRFPIGGRQPPHLVHR